MDRKDRLIKARNFCVYYGKDKKKKFSQFDIVIVEPMAYTLEKIREMQISGALVLAYLSVMEVSKTSENIKLMEEKDFIRIKGQQMMNAKYDTYITDIRSKKWNSVLHHDIGRLLIHSGYDGIFLDTIGDVELKDFPLDIRDSVLWATIDFVQRVKAQFPEYMLIQNNGLEILCQYTAPFIDGICWENPPLDKKADSKWSDMITKRLQWLMKKEGLKILLLVEERNDIKYDSCLKLAQKNGFLSYLAPYNYL